MSLCDDCGGACCRNIMFLVSGVNEDQKRWMLTRGSIIDGVWYVNAKCRHLDKYGLCSIYETRPEVCKRYKVGGADCLATRKARGL